MRNTNKRDLLFWTLEPVVDVLDRRSSVAAYVVKFAIKKARSLQWAERYQYSQES